MGNGLSSSLQSDDAGLGSLQDAEWQRLALTPDLLSNALISPPHTPSADVVLESLHTYAGANAASAATGVGMRAAQTGAPVFPWGRQNDEDGPAFCWRCGRRGRTSCVALPPCALRAGGKSLSHCVAVCAMCVRFAVVCR
jgi:hypothetical protein